MSASSPNNPNDRPAVKATARATADAIVELGAADDIAACLGRLAVIMYVHTIEAMRHHESLQPAHMRRPDAEVVEEARQFVRRAWTVPLDNLGGGSDAIHIRIKDTR